MYRARLRVPGYLSPLPPLLATVTVRGMATGLPGAEWPAVRWAHCCAPSGLCPRRPSIPTFPRARADIGWCMGQSGVPAIPRAEATGLHRRGAPPGLELPGIRVLSQPPEGLFPIQLRPRVHSGSSRRPIRSCCWIPHRPLSAGARERSRIAAAGPELPLPLHKGKGLGVRASRPPTTQSPPRTQAQDTPLPALGEGSGAREVPQLTVTGTA
jgi:hypothetical protein